jgi:hypothetical protein
VNPCTIGANGPISCLGSSTEILRNDVRLDMFREEKWRDRTFLGLSPHSETTIVASLDTRRRRVLAAKP